MAIAAIALFFAGRLSVSTPPEHSSLGPADICALNLARLGMERQQKFEGRPELETLTAKEIIDKIPPHQLLCPVSGVPYLSEGSKVDRQTEIKCDTPGHLMGFCAGDTPPSPSPSPETASSEKEEKIMEKPKLEVKITPVKEAVYRGIPVKFKAVASGTEKASEYVFSEVVELAPKEEGVDEVPETHQKGTSADEASLSFSSLGKKTVMVRVFSDSGASARAQTQVEVVNRPPEVEIKTVPESPVEGSKLVVLASGKDPDDDKIAYKFYLNGVVVPPLKDGKSAEIKIEASGKNTVGVRASDKFGGESFSEKIIQADRSPRPNSE